MVLGKFFKSVVPAKRPPSLPSNREIARAQGIFGALESYSKRRAGERIALELEAATSAAEAATSLNHAKAEFARSVGMLAPGNLERMAHEEEMKVEETFIRQELQLADIRLQKEMFVGEAKKRQRRQETELMEEEIRYQRVYEELHGRPAPKDETPETKRAALETMRDEVVEQIKVLVANYAKKSADDSFAPGEEENMTRENNRLIEKLERYDAELDAF